MLIDAYWQTGRQDVRIADFYLCTTGRTGFRGGVTGGRGRHRGQTLEFPTNTNFIHLLKTPVLIFQINKMEMLQQKYPACSIS